MSDGRGDWVTDGVRAVLPELEPDFDHADYSPTPVTDSLAGVTVEARLDTVVRERLRELYGTVR